MWIQCICQPNVDWNKLLEMVNAQNAFTSSQSFETLPLSHPNNIDGNFYFLLTIGFLTVASFFCNVNLKPKKTT